MDIRMENKSIIRLTIMDHNNGIYTLYIWYQVLWMLLEWRAMNCC